MNNCPSGPFFFDLFFLAIMLVLAGCSGASRSMTSADLHSFMDQEREPVIIDVRSKGDFDEAHIPGAIHIPFYSVDKRYQEISTVKDTPVVVYCAHGPRAWWAVFVLRGKGFTQVNTLEGHFKKWQENDFAFEKNK